MGLELATPRLLQNVFVIHIAICTSILEIVMVWASFAYPTNKTLLKRWNHSQKQTFHVLVPRGSFIFSHLLLIMMGVIHEVDSAYSVQIICCVVSWSDFSWQHTTVDNYELFCLIFLFYYIDFHLCYISCGCWVWTTSFYAVLKSFFFLLRSCWVCSCPLLSTILFTSISLSSN